MRRPLSPRPPPGRAWGWLRRRWQRQSGNSGPAPGTPLGVGSFPTIKGSTNGDTLWARRHLDEGQRATVAARLANLPNSSPPPNKPANLPTYSEADGWPHAPQRRRYRSLRRAERARAGSDNRSPKVMCRCKSTSKIDRGRPAPAPTQTAETFLSKFERFLSKFESFLSDCATELSRALAVPKCPGIAPAAVTTPIGQFRY